MNNNLSVSEDKSVASEADLLCSLAEKHNDQLFKFKQNQTIVIDNNKFHCISSDKNIIFKVQGKYHWYLKFSLQEEWVNREITGAKAVKKTLNQFDGYQHANVIRASIKNKYTLYSSVDGMDFNTILLKACLIGIVKFPDFITPVMQNLGGSIGRLHSYDISPEIKALNPSTSHYINSYLNELKESNAIVDKIEHWIEKHPITSESTGWVHGNIKSEDVIISNGKVTLIDFGTCGFGEQYEDLNNLCAYMWLLRAVPLFPWRIAQHAMAALFDGYAKEHHYDKKALTTYMTYGILRYYIKNVVMGKGMATLSKMPVSRSRIDHLILNLLEDNNKNSFEDIYTQR